MGVFRHKSIIKSDKGTTFLILLGFEIEFSHVMIQAVDDNAAIDQFPPFFESARLNFAENMLSDKDDSIAIINMNENNMSKPELYSWQDLREMVREFADALKSSGLKKGQVVTCMESSPFSFPLPHTLSLSWLTKSIVNSDRIQLYSLACPYVGDCRGRGYI